MRVLMLSFDATMLKVGESGPSPTLERHVLYNRALRRSGTSGAHAGSGRGGLTVLVRVPPGSADEPREPEPGLRIHPVPCRRAAYLPHLLARARRLTDGEPVDVVTCQTPFDDAVAALRIGSLGGAGVNIQMRSSFLDDPRWIGGRPLIYRVFNRLGKWTSRRADTIRVVSRGEKERLEERFPELGGKIHLLRPYIDRAAFEPPLTSAELQDFERARQRYSVGGGYFLFVGRLAVEKNLSLLLKAFRRVVDHGSDVKLVLAGNGPMDESLRRQATRLRIRDRTVWLGNASLRQLRPWYGSAIATVLPSRHEGFPRVVLESYLMSTPVVVTPFVSASELVRAGRTGLIVNGFDDPDLLAAELQRLVDDREAGRRMGVAGRSHAENYLLSDDQYTTRLVDIWRRTAERRNPDRGDEIGGSRTDDGRTRGRTDDGRIGDGGTDDGGAS